jgi:hypothetical protein
VLGIDVARLRIARVVPGSVLLDLDVLEDPRIANAPIPPPAVDSSRNVDAATAAQLAQLPAEQQAAALQQYYNQSTGAPAAGEGGGTGPGSSSGTTAAGPSGSGAAGSAGNGSSGGGAPDPDLGLTGNVTATVAAGAELMVVLAKLQQAAASGNLSASLGVEVLSMSAKVM